MIEEYPELRKDEIGTMSRFVYDISKDDIVILPTYPEDFDIVYLIGRIKSYDTYYEENPQDKAYEKTRRKVKWLSSAPRKMFSERLQASLNTEHTVYNIDKHANEINAWILGRLY